MGKALTHCLLFLWANNPKGRGLRMEINLSEIIIGDERRDVNYEKVKELAESIKEIGLINPITITKQNVLVAGRHRIEAFKKLGFKEIECIIVNLEGLKAELAEIDENLIRNELHYIDRGKQLTRRKQIYENLYPETKKQTGKKLAEKRWNAKADSVPASFVSDTSTKTSKSETVIKEELQIASKIVPEVQRVIKEKDIKKTDALKIARLEPEQQKKIAEKFTNSNAKSLLDANRLIKKEEVHETPAIEGKYRVIYADPPWKYSDKLTEGYGAAENHYPSMSIKELCELPVKELAEENAVLFLWVTSPLLEESFQIMHSWGFKYKASFVWDKIKHNMGHYNSVRHEFLLIAVRGSCQPDVQKLFDSVQSIERTKHSEKPETFREIIDTIYRQGSRIELFARKKAVGWDVWGNQT